MRAQDQCQHCHAAEWVRVLMPRNWPQMPPLWVCEACAEELLTQPASRQTAQAWHLCTEVSHAAQVRAGKVGQ